MSKDIKIFLVYFLAVFLKIIFKNFSFSLQFLSFRFGNLLLWLSGGLFGWYLLLIDQLVWVYFTQPKSEISLAVRALIGKKDWKGLFKFLRLKEYEQKGLAFKSFLFQIAWVVLAFFIISSSASYLGKGMVMGVGLNLLYKEWQDFNKYQRFDWLFWQIKREVNLKEQKNYLMLMTGIFVMLSLLV